MSQRKEENSPNPPPAIEEHGRSGASLLRVGLDPIGCSGFDSVAGAERQAERIYPGSTTSWSDSHFSEAEVTEYLDELWKDSQYRIRQSGSQREFALRSPGLGRSLRSSNRRCLNFASATSSRAAAFEVQPLQFGEGFEGFQTASGYRGAGQTQIA